MAHTNQPEDLISRIRRLEQRLHDLENRQGLTSAVIRKGGITMRDDATLMIVDADGDLISKIGALGWRYTDTGRAQQGAEFRYEDGSAAFIVGRPGATLSTQRQYTAMYNGGTVVLSTDAESGMGLGRPWLPIPFSDGQPADWPNTTSATFVNLLEANVYQQHPWIEARIGVTNTSSSSGEARLMVNGVQVGDTIVMSGAPIAVFRSARINNPFGSAAQVTVEARRTAGTGNIYVRADGHWRQT